MAAIVDPELGELIAQLDSLLTGKSVRECLRNLTSSAQDETSVLWWLENLYYLSDGGYSRIAMAKDDTCRLFLCMGCLSRPAINWDKDESAALRTQIEARLLAQLENLG